jgi:hypothetical protein
MSDKYPIEEFNIREAKGKDFYKIMVVNTALTEYRFKNDFPWCLIVEVDIKDQTQLYKLPTESEGIILNFFEDTLSEIIKGNCSSLYVGRITDNGHRSLYYHIDSPKDVHEALQKFISSGLHSHEFEYNITKDEQWNSTKIFFD